jgi:hypothetical protein
LAGKAVEDSMSRSIIPFLWLLSLVLLRSSASAGVHIVGTGPGDQPTIQAAVDASQSGDLVLIRPGTYTGFTIDGKGITVACHSLGEVMIQGTVEVKNVASGDTVVLTGLSATGLTISPAALPALKLTDNAGAVRVENSIWNGGNGLMVQTGAYNTWGAGAHGVIVSGSFNVSIAGCTLRAGNGGGEDQSCYDCTGGAGGDALNTATSAVALYDCTLRGGNGGDAGYQGGRGGTGTTIVSWGIFASKCTFRGGDGGTGWDFYEALGGDGGNGLTIPQNTGARLLDNTCIGGAGGACPSFPQFAGAPGQPILALGLKIDVNGAGRTFHTSALTDSAQAFSITVNGQPGDGVYVMGDAVLGFQFKWGFHGVWLLGFPLPISIDPLGTIPASGTLTVQMQLAGLPAGTGYSRLYLQGLVRDAQGGWFLGASMSVSRLSCATLAPDCDGNGQFDYCDLMAGSLTDCDHNGVPDACEPDCNGNGVADACDIASHTSADLNNNGIPDECEPPVSAWYVEASAPTGGDGSAAHPFQTLAQAFTWALSGETIYVRDGVYTGNANKNLRFNGRDLVVQSVNGPSACIIDLQNQGRAFEIRDGETPAARVQGLTIKNGNTYTPVSGTTAAAGILVLSSSPTIEHCVFDHCLAGNAGGAIALASSASIVKSCVFNANTAAAVYGGGGVGGGISCDNGAARIEYCVFTDNSAAEEGGAVAFDGVSAPGGIVTHSVLHHNEASIYGGAVSTNSGWATIDDCLITENRTDFKQAGEGGGIGGWGVMVVTNCTIARNTSSASGGGFACRNPGCRLSNCILWQNSATTSGAQIALTDSSSGLTVAACDVRGGQSAVYVFNGASLVWGSGNLDTDPLFTDPNGPDNDPLTIADNDWRLALPSPCIDAGNNSLVEHDWADLDGDGDTVEPVPFDLDGLSRFADVASIPDTGSGSPPIVDIGCYEHRP